MIHICKKCSDGDKQIKYTSDKTQAAYSCDATYCPNFFDRPQFTLLTKEQAEDILLKPVDNRF